MPVFVAWQGFDFYADRFETDDVLFRVCMLDAMVGARAVGYAGNEPFLCANLLAVLLLLQI